MKCAECSDRWKCGAGYDLRRKRRGCEKAIKPAKRSNADRIRAMTDEELAEKIASVFDCDHHKCPAERNKCYKCVESWLDWLKQEAADKDGEA